MQIKLYTNKLTIKDIDNIINSNGEILKDDIRSFIKVVEYKNKKYLYKIPRDKNKRLLKKLFSPLVGSESYNLIQGMLFLKNINITSNEPIALIEKKFLGFVYWSALICTYIEGKIPEESDLAQIIKLLNKLHSYKVYHKDSQFSNFIINNSSIALIDFVPHKAILGQISYAHDFVKLKNSRPKIEKYLPESITKSKAYKLAKIYDNIIKKWRKLKKIKRRLF